MATTAVASTLLVLSGGVAQAAPSPTVATHTAAVMAPDSISACQNPSVPSWFWTALKSAAVNKSTLNPTTYPWSNIPDSWAHDENMARIACYESSFRTSAENPSGPYYGLGQMSASNISHYKVSFTDYEKGTSAYKAQYWQLLAAFRYCKDRYGSPGNGWKHEVADGWW